MFRFLISTFLGAFCHQSLSIFFEISINSRIFSFISLHEVKTRRLLAWSSRGRGVRFSLCSSRSGFCQPSPVGAGGGGVGSREHFELGKTKQNQPRRQRFLCLRSPDTEATRFLLLGAGGGEGSGALVLTFPYR